MNTRFLCVALLLGMAFSRPLLFAQVAESNDARSAEAKADEPKSSEPNRDETTPGESAGVPSDALFRSDNLLDIQITVKEADWDLIRKQSRSLFSALRGDQAPSSPFTYVSADININGRQIKNVGLRKKGFLGSLDENRPSLKIKFDKYQDQLPYGDLKRLTLNNNKQDESLLSQYMAYKLFRDSGTVASRCNFAKVTVNGEYLGVYSHVESVKRPMLKRGFGVGKGMLLEGTVADLHGKSRKRLEPKTEGASTLELERLAAILSEEQLNSDRLAEFLDVDAFLRFWAMESLLAFWDGYSHNQNNYYIYRHPETLKYYFLPWGLDSAFTYNVPGVIERVPFDSFHCQSILSNRLYHDAEMRQRYRQTLEGLLESHWIEDELLAEIDRVTSMLAPHVRHERRFRRAVGRVRKFIEGRRQRVQSELDEWPLPLRKGVRTPGFVQQVGTASAQFTTAWETENKKGTEESNSESSASANRLELTLRGEPIIFKRVDVNAGPNKRKPADRDGRRPPSLAFVGHRKSDGKRYTLALELKRAEFAPSQDFVTAGGVLIEGNMLAFMTQMMVNPASLTLVEAQVKLTKAGMENGEPISGEATFTLFQFAKGETPTVAWKEP